MADPYAAREGAPLGEQPAGEGPVTDLVGRLQGLPLRGLIDLDDDRLASARFVAVVVRDQGVLPPVARIDAAFALVLLLGPADGSVVANRALERLTACGLEIFLVKEGIVALTLGTSGVVKL